MIFSGLKPISLAIGLSACLVSPVAAQNLFSPAILVNEAVITGYEIEQRLQFLKLLGSPGATRDAVREALIDDRLRMQAVRQAGLEPSQEEIEEGMSEFAARTDLNSEQFLAALQSGGVDQETFRDFVANGIGWRNLIRARFGRRVDVSDAEINRALGAANGDISGIRVLLSEIIIPLRPDQADQIDALAEEISQTKDQELFSEYARTYSATASRDQGGRLDWQDLSTLPPVLQPLLLALTPGDVTSPLQIPNAIALFQMRDIRETGANSTRYAAYDYATYLIPGGRSPEALTKAREIADTIDVCDDLYGVAFGEPEDRFERQTLPTGDIPQDIAIELAKLDPNEVSTALTRSQGEDLVLLMLCGRTTANNEEVDREQVIRNLRSAQLEAYAASFLEELRADARIVAK